MTPKNRTIPPVAGPARSACGLFVAAVLAAVLASPEAAVAADSLPAGRAGNWQVLTRFSASGSLRAAVAAPIPPDEETPPGETATLEVVEHAVAVNATLQYVERPAAAAASGVAGRTVERHYDRAEAVLQIDDTTVRTILPSDAEVVLITAADGRLHPWLADGFVTREERDLLTLPFDPAWHAAVSPPAAAAAGTTWTLTTDGLAALLCIDTVTGGEVTATVKQAEADLLTVSLAGEVRGAVDGVPTVIDLSASYRWDASQLSDTGLIGLEAQLHERRQAGHITPGLDIEATVEITRRQAVAASDDSRQAPKTFATASRPPRRGPGQPGSLWLSDPHGRFDLVYGTRWRAIEQQADQTVLRLIDEGRLLGQASIIPLPPTGDAPSLAAFQRDIERSLTGQFNHLVSAAESRRSDGTQILRVASDGEADGLPFRWVHYHLTAANGGQATLSFMVESGQLERFGEADQQLVDGFAVAGIAD